MTLKGQITSTTGAKARSAWSSIGRSGPQATTPESALKVSAPSIEPHLAARGTAWARSEPSKMQATVQEAGSMHRARPSRDDIRDNQIWVGPRFLTRRPSGGLRRADPVDMPRAVSSGNASNSICGGSEASRFAVDFPSGDFAAAGSRRLKGSSSRRARPSSISTTRSLTGEIAVTPLSASPDIRCEARSPPAA